MDAIKTILMGCGALALLSVVGCVGLAGAGSYALNQAVEEDRNRDFSNPVPSRSSSSGKSSGSFSEDPFSDYGGGSSDDDEAGGWSDEAQ
jgi:hypothetical protein